jgi:hypothetical protein
MPNNSGAWKDFLQLTHNLSTPGVAKKIVPPFFLDLYPKLLRDVVMEFAKRKEPHNGLKIFVNRMQDNSYNAKLLEQPPKKHESLHEWVKHFFEGEPHGMVMNYLEDYSNELVQHLAQMVVPLLEQAGMPPAGLSMLFFMGNYGFTPFGVHRGTPGDDGFLFHLGPGKKTFYIWDTAEYNELTDFAESYADVERILPYATAYELEPGDVIFFPPDLFHVAYTPEFSMSLVLDYRKPPKLEFIKLLLEKTSFEEEANPFFIQPVNMHAQKKDLLQRERDVLFSAQLMDAWEQVFCGLKSNGGFFKPSLADKRLYIDEGIYKVKAPFQVVVLEKGNALQLFARGHSWMCKKTPAVHLVVEKLNSKGFFSMEELIKSFTPEYTLTECYEWAVRLMQTDILEKIED